MTHRTACARARALRHGTRISINLLAFVWLAGSVGCGGGAAPGTDASADGGVGQVEFGTGTVAFEEITPGQDLGLVAGPQGGFHFLAHARMSGLEPGDPDQLDDPRNPLTSFEAFDAAGVRIDVMLPPRQLGYRAVGQGLFALPSARILQIENDVVPDVLGTTVRLTVRIEDADGAVATDDVMVNVVPAQ